MKPLDYINSQLARLSEESFYLIVISLLTFVVALTLTLADLELQRNFLVIACDTAAYQNTLANVLHWHFFRDTAYDGPNILGLHSCFILLLIAPIYAMYPSVDLLFILQVWGIYGSVIPAYLIAARYLNNPYSAFLVGLYVLFSPLLLLMGVAPFHPESWIITFVLWSIYFCQENHSRGFRIFMVLALSCAEQAALIYIALGLAILFTKDRFLNRWIFGLQSLAAGVGWLFFSELIVIPFMHQPEQRNLIAYNYSNWGVESAVGFVLTLIGQPVNTLLMLCNPHKWGYLLELIGLPLVLALCYKRSLFLLAPIPIFFLMIDQEYFLPIHAYYLEFALFAGIIGLILFLKRWGINTRLGIVISILTIFVNICKYSAIIGLFGISASFRDSSETLNDELHREFNLMPLEMGVYCPHRYSAYLSNHYNMVMGDSSYNDDDFNVAVEKQFSSTDVHADQISFVVCDLQDDQPGTRSESFDTSVAHHRAENMQKLVQNGGWDVFWNQPDSNIIILKRRPSPF